MRMLQPKQVEENKTPSDPMAPPSQGPSRTARTPAYQRLAADVPGRELAPEASIWQIYVDEAQEHDTELFKRENGNLDMMLLFAALFSAILTAFIIESKNLLQQDPSDATVALLLIIAQSQQRIEQGVPQIMPPVEVPSFSSTASARWINGLWFSALALSLAAALVAMLAKEWLTAFTSPRPRPPHASTMEHQRRLRGFEEWGALHMIDLLPSMLHLSLLLFSLGLAVYLWGLDSGIAIAEVVITGVTLTFYVGTALLGAWTKTCPFVTQVSKYIRVLSQRAGVIRDVPAGDPGERLDAKVQSTATVTTNEELGALRWLTETTRDPDVVDFACQALANLQVNHAPASAKIRGDLGHKSKWNALIHTMHGWWRGLDGPVDHTQVELQGHLLKLWESLCSRISEGWTHLSQEPPETRGLNMVRLAYATPPLVRCIKPETWSGRTSPTTEPPAVAAFRFIDAVWNGKTPNLLPDFYASFLAVELLIVADQASENKLRLEKGTEVRWTDNTADRFSIEMGAQTHISGPHDALSLFELRARYSRSLARAGFLFNYFENETRTSEQSLVFLIDSIRVAGLCKAINIETHMSSCHPQSNTGSVVLPEFSMRAMGNRYNYHIVSPLDMGNKDSVTSGLVRLVASACVHDMPRLQFAAANTLQVMYPMLVKQWMSMKQTQLGENQTDVAENVRFAKSALADWPSQKNTNQSEQFTRSILVQLATIAAISVSQVGWYNSSDLAGIAIGALSQVANTQSGKAAEHVTLSIHLFTLRVSLEKRLKDLVRYLSLNFTKLSNATESANRVLELFHRKHDSSDVLVQKIFEWARIPALLTLVKQANYEAGRTKELLGNIQRLVRERDDFRMEFVANPEYFTNLSSLGQEAPYTSAVADCIVEIIDIMHHVKDRRGSLIKLQSPAVKPILGATLLATQYLLKEDINRMEPLVSQVLDILERSNFDSQETARWSEERNRLCERLDTAAKAHEQLRAIAIRFEEWDGYAKALRGVAWLFDRQNDGVLEFDAGLIQPSDVQSS